MRQHSSTYKSYALALDLLIQSIAVLVVFIRICLYFFLSRFKKFVSAKFIFFILKKGVIMFKIVALNDLSKKEDDQQDENSTQVSKEAQVSGFCRTVYDYH
jgi:hypothetical protein